MSLCQPVIWSMAAMLRDSVVVVIVRTRPRAIPLAMITMRKSTHGFLFVSHIWVAYGAPLGGPSGRRSSPTSIDISIKNKCFPLFQCLGKANFCTYFERSIVIIPNANSEC